MRSGVVLVFILFLTASSLIMIKPTCAQLPTPSVPEFTLKFIDNSYDYYVQPVTTTSTDPYTGNVTSTTTPGYTQHVENKSIQITIKNQPFTSYSSGKSIYLFYNVREKGHFTDSWGQLYSESSLLIDMNDSSARRQFSGNLPRKSNSDYTVLLVPTELSPGAQVDFQVEAITGYDSQALMGNPDHPLMPFPMGFTYVNVIEIDQRSGWSNTQTITIPANAPLSPAPTPTLTSTPTQNNTSVPSPAISTSPSPANVQGVSQAEFYAAIAVLSGIVVAFLVAVVVLASKVKKANLGDNKQ